jgi:hypothetical protein
MQAQEGAQLSSDQAKDKIWTVGVLHPGAAESAQAGGTIWAIRSGHR